MKKLEEKREVFRYNLKPMSLRIMAEMRSEEERMDKEGLRGDSNLAPN